MSKSLDLKGTVSGADPDGSLAKMTGAGGPQKIIVVSAPGSVTLGLAVTKVERADGQPFGVDAEFETWWADSHYEEDETDDVDKEWARDAFLYGVKFGKEKGRSA